MDNLPNVLLFHGALLFSLVLLEALIVRVTQGLIPNAGNR